MTPNLQIEYRPIDALLPYARNPRTHSPAQIAKIAASIVEFGWTQPILVDGESGIIAGHGRLAAARKLELSEVPVIELGHLTAAQKRAYVIADNRLALDAGWDDELLALELVELSEAGYDLQLTGFDDDELAQMLADIGHPFAKGKKVYDVTFENVQAGLRTDYLFRLANQQRGLVVGTGDLSELGLGWCTYGVGDHMSHYNPNGSVSKTLIQHLIRFVAASGDVSKDTAAILHDILNTEISPELIPAGEKGVVQATESFVGPYALQDFNLYYLTRLGYRPSKIAFLAWNAWHDIEKGAWPANLPEGTRRAYTLEEIRSWLALFLRRFFTNQFKRSALPNGPKISSGGSLSPRGDWRAPSDGSPDVWLEEMKAIPQAKRK